MLDDQRQYENSKDSRAAMREDYERGQIVSTFIHVTSNND